MENQEENLENVSMSIDCDIATKPNPTPVPAGMSTFAYPACNKATGQWEWVDPAVAVPED